jgi:MFS family permease
MNYFTGLACDKLGRKKILIAGWLIGLPVPILLIIAPNWNWVVFANILLGLNQGMTWSTTVIMKIDLVGPKQRGLAMGLNEFAGYVSVALASLASGYIAVAYGLQPYPFYLGIIFAVTGIIISIFFVNDTTKHAAFEANTNSIENVKLSVKEIFFKTSFTNKNLASVSQTGFVNNLNDGMVWGLFPLFFASIGLTIDKIGLLSAIYPASWGVIQLVTGPLSDKIGRKWLIVFGMWIQAIGIAFVVFTSEFNIFVICALLLGIGTAMVYPTLLASIGDVASASWRASAVGVYRLWRDFGYVAGAFISGITADLFGINSAIIVVAVITFASGMFSALFMQETKI